MINIAEMKLTLDAARQQGLNARQRILHESPAIVEQASGSSTFALNLV